MIEHTGTPWAVAVRLVEDKTAIGNVIIHTQEDVCLAICDASKTLPMDKCVANAKLMKAAPKMLFALTYARTFALPGSAIRREIDEAIESTKELL